VTLPTFAAARRAAAAPLLLSAGQQSTDVLPAGHSAANPQQRCVNDGTEWQTNGRPTVT